MIDMLKCETEIPEIAKVIKKYGVGFDVIYFDGKADGKAVAKLETAENLLKAGVDIEIISQCTGFTVDQLKELKRNRVLENSCLKLVENIIYFTNYSS